MILNVQSHLDVFNLRARQVASTVSDSVRPCGLSPARGFSRQEHESVATAFSAVYSEAGTYVRIWKAKENLIYDSLENFAMQEGEYSLRD